MNFIETQLITALQKSLKDNYSFDVPQDFISLEIPARSEQGDYASNLAMRLTKELKRNPREIAQSIDGQFRVLPRTCRPYRHQERAKSGLHLFSAQSYCNTCVRIPDGIHHSQRAEVDRRGCESG